MIASGWYLMIGIVLGVLGTTAMKLSHGLQRLKPTICLFIFYGVSFVAMTFAVKGIDISIVYAIWSGMGTLFMAIIGVLLFGETISFQKIVSLLCIVVGVLGFHFVDIAR